MDQGPQPVGAPAASEAASAPLAAPGSTFPEPPLPSAPPTTPGPISQIRSRAGNTWPDVIGIISIILGSLAALGGIINALTQALMSFWAPAVSGASNAPPPSGSGNPPFDLSSMLRSMGQWAPLASAANLLLCAIAGLLIFSGAGVLKRRRWGAVWIKRWAVIKILGGVLMAVVTGLMQSAQFSSMSQSGAAGSGPGSAAIGAMAPVIAAFTGCFTILFYAAYPIFILIWMNRSLIKAQTRSWA